MKLRDQCQSLRQRIDVSHHAFFNLIAQAIQRELNERAKLEMTLTSKTTAKQEIKASLVGQLTTLNQTEFESTERHVRDLITKLRNARALLDLMG